MSSSPLFGITSSWTGKTWILRDHNQRISDAIGQRLGLPEFLARSLSARGFDIETAEAFLDPTLRRWLPDPSSLCDMDKAINRVRQAVENGEKIAIWGDYDVDGATSAAVIIRFLRAVGASEPVLYVPDRQREGYGPNASGLLKLGASGVALVICVDCGTMAHDPLAEAHKAGIDVIVIDHHQADAVLPVCHAIINPKRLDEPKENPFKNLAAVGVVYLFLIALNRELRRTWYNNKNITEPDLRRWLDLVAIGTVCDVMPLIGLNRVFVRQGLRVLSQGHNVGLRALGGVSGIKDQISASTLGFVFGPRINAGGRVGDSAMGAQLLATDDCNQATKLAQCLDQFNAERRLIEADVLESAIKQGRERAALEEPAIIVAAPEWHVGVIGIVAARLRELFNRTTFVIAIDDSDIGKGSGRSHGGVDIGEIVLAAKQAGIIIGGGGHAMAAGLTVARNNISAFREFVIRYLRDRDVNYVQRLTVDSIISIPALQSSLLDSMQLLEPFGVGNPDFRFVISECNIIKCNLVGQEQNHISIVVKQAGASIRAIAFRAAGNALGENLLNAKDRPCNLVGTLRADRWNGKNNVQFIIEDGSFYDCTTST